MSGNHSQPRLLAISGSLRSYSSSTLVLQHITEKLAVDFRIDTFEQLHELPHVADAIRSFRNA